jgi:formylglycine-generating enzyme required for sulfatase activity
VTLSPFALDRTEVTNEAFARWLSSSKSIVRDDRHLRASGQVLIDLALSELHLANTSFEPIPDAARHPVRGVSPAGARAYCAAQGKHLATEAQWEYAARGNSHRQYPWGDTPHPQQLGCQLSIGRAYDSGRGAAEPCPLRDVATSSDVTPEGVFDLGGNVSEWVADRFADTDPHYPHCGDCRDPEVTEGEKQVIRGGNHVFGPSVARAAARSRAPVNDVLSNTGFRCAR